MSATDLDTLFGPKADAIATRLAEHDTGPRSTGGATEAEIDKLLGLSIGRPLAANPPSTPPPPGPTGLRGRLLTGSALFTLPDRQHLVDGLLLKDTIAATYGPPKSNKTFVTLDRALSICTGRDWCGRQVEAGPVVYVAAEGAYGLRHRIAAWCDYHQVDRSELGNFHLLPERVDVLDRHQVDELAAMTGELAAVYVVLDTLSRCLAGGDENSPKDMGAAVEALDAVRRAGGACVEAVHHSGKDRDRGLRGHSLLLGAIDTALEVATTGQRVTVAVTAQKDLPDDAVLRFRMERHHASLVPVPDRQAAPGPGARRETLTAVMERISDALIARPGMSKSELRNTISGSTDDKKAATDALIADGWLEVTAEGVGKAHLCRMVRPYRAINDPASATYDPTAEVPEP